MMRLLTIGPLAIVAPSYGGA